MRTHATALAELLGRWVNPVIVGGVNPTAHHGVVAQSSPDYHRARRLTELLTEPQFVLLDRARASAIHVGIRSDTHYEIPLPHAPAVRQPLGHRDRRAGHALRCPPKR